MDDKAGLEYEPGKEAPEDDAAGADDRKPRPEKEKPRKKEQARRRRALGSALSEPLRCVSVLPWRRVSSRQGEGERERERGP